MNAYYRPQRIELIGQGAFIDLEHLVRLTSDAFTLLESPRIVVCTHENRNISLLALPL